MENSRFMETIKIVAEEKKYGRGRDHAEAVRDSSLQLYDGLLRLDMLPRVGQNRMLLEASCYLHDVGVPLGEDHNETGFMWLIRRLSGPDCREVLTEADQAKLEYCVLWHRGDDYGVRLEKAYIECDNMLQARCLAAILRVGDGLNFPGGRQVKDVSVSLEKDILVIEATPASVGSNLETQCDKADKKKDLLLAVIQAMGLNTVLDIKIRKSGR